MKKNTMTIDIKKPVDIVFQFTINPSNTPKWIPSILEEKVLDLPVKLGTIYHQKVQSKNNVEQAKLIVIEFIENERLGFHLANSKYTCYYKYEKISEGTRITYSEENGIDGNLEEPMSIENLKKLKNLLESR